MIMRDTPGDAELVAMVAEPEWVPAFVAVPHLIAACQEIVTAFPDYEGLSTQQSLALASVRSVLSELKKVEKS